MRAFVLTRRIAQAPSPFFVSVRARMVQLQGDHIIAEGVMRQARLLERLQAVSEVKMALRDTQLAAKLRDTKVRAALARSGCALLADVGARCVRSRRSCTRRWRTRRTR